MQCIFSCARRRPIRPRAALGAVLGGLFIVGCVASAPHESAGAPHESAGAPHESAGAPHESAGAARESAGAPSASAAGENLRRIGLEIVSDEDARIPVSERGRYLACRVIEGADRPALAPHEAGYLFVEVETGNAGSEEAGGMNAETIRAALAAWRPGETLDIRVRRNPYLFRSPQWWERRVTFLLPAE